MRMHPGSLFPALRLAGSSAWLHVGVPGGALYADAQVPPGSSRAVILTRGRVCAQGVYGNARRHFFFFKSQLRVGTYWHQWAADRGAVHSFWKPGCPSAWDPPGAAHHFQDEAPSPSLGVQGPSPSGPAERCCLPPRPPLCTPPSSSSSLPLDLVGLSLPHAFG